jgi:hypothetical protein
VAKKFRKVQKGKASGVPKKYLSGAKNKRKKAEEIKRTALAYKRGERIDVAAVSRSRMSQAKKRKRR